MGGKFQVKTLQDTESQTETSGQTDRELAAATAAETHHKSLYSKTKLIFRKMSKHQVE